MKVLMRISLLCCLIAFSFGAVEAQGTPEASNALPSPFASGIDAEATYLDQRGTSIISFKVTGIEREWQGYSSYNEPQAGKEYVYLAVSITNHSNRPYIVEPYDFEMVDSLGIRADRAWVSDDVRVMTQDTTIDGGQTIETGLVFEMFLDLAPLMLIYQPEYEVFVVIHLGE